MFSLQKILVLFAILAAIWYGFRLVNRLDRARRQKLREEAGGRPPEASRAREDVVDLVRNKDGSYGSGDRDRRS